MAVLSKNGKEIEVKDGDSIIDAAEKLGVPFSCFVGICGTCKTEILSGKENLSDLTENEKDFGLKENERLICQCKIKSGKVELK